MNTLKQSITTLSLALAVGSAQAETKNVDHHGLYLGAGYGFVKAEGADEFDDDNDVGRILIGGQFHQVVSVEGSYIDFGKYGDNAASADIDGYTLAVKAGLPLGEHVTLYALGGNLWWDSDFQALGLKGDADGQELFYGAGASLALSKSLDLRLEYNRFNVEFDRDEIGIFGSGDDLDTDLDYASVAVQYTF